MIWKNANPRCSKRSRYHEGRLSLRTPSSKPDSEKPYNQLAFAWLCRSLCDDTRVSVRWRARGAIIPQIVGVDCSQSPWKLSDVI
jgi:hypothetical protein